MLVPRERLGELYAMTMKLFRTATPPDSERPGPCPGESGRQEWGPRSAHSGSSRALLRVSVARTW